MKTLKIIGAVSLLALVVFSCKETQQAIETTGRVQLDGQYDITTLDGNAVNGLTINFSGITKRVTGNGGCNQYFADFTLNNLNLTIGEIGATKKACPTLNTEQKLFNILRNVSTYNSRGNSLTLYNTNNEIIIQATEK